MFTKKPTSALGLHGIAVGQNSPDNDVLRVAVPRQQNRIRRQQGNEEGSFRFPAKAPQSRGQLAIKLQPNQTGTKFSAGAARAGERQVHYRRRTPQVILPIIEFFRQPFPSQPTSLPSSVVRILHRQFRERIFPAGQTPAVDGREFPQQNLNRPVIADDMVHRQVQHVVVPGKADHPHTPQRAAGKVEALAMGRAKAGIDRRFTTILRQMTQVYERKYARTFGRNCLHRAAARHPKGCTQVVVPGADRRERSFQRRRIQKAFQPKRPHHVERLTRPLHSGEHPEPLLREGQRRLDAPGRRPNHVVSLDTARPFHRLRQSSQRGTLEQAVGRQHDAEGSGNPSHNLHRKQGMAAQGEEVFLQADPLPAEKLRPDFL